MAASGNSDEYGPVEPIKKDDGFGPVEPVVKAASASPQTTGQMSKLESASRGAGNVIPGYNNLNAGLDAAFNPGKDDGTFVERFLRNKLQEEALQKKAHDDNPGTYNTARVLETAASLPLMGLAAKGLGAAEAVAPATSAIGKFAQGLGGGASVMGTARLAALYGLANGPAHIIGGQEGPELSQAFRDATGSEQAMLAAKKIGTPGERLQGGWDMLTKTGPIGMGLGFIGLNTALKGAAPAINYGRSALSRGAGTVADIASGPALEARSATIQEANTKFAPIAKALEEQDNMAIKRNVSDAMSKMPMSPAQRAATAHDIWGEGRSMVDRPDIDTSIQSRTASQSAKRGVAMNNAAGLEGHGVPGSPGELAARQKLMGGSDDLPGIGKASEAQARVTREASGSPTQIEDLHKVRASIGGEEPGVSGSQASTDSIPEIPILMDGMELGNSGFADRNSMLSETATAGQTNAMPGRTQSASNWSPGQSLSGGPADGINRLPNETVKQYIDYLAAKQKSGAGMSAGDYLPAEPSIGQRAGGYVSDKMNSPVGMLKMAANPTGTAKSILNEVAMPSTNDARAQLYADIVRKYSGRAEDFARPYQPPPTLGRPGSPGGATRILGAMSQRGGNGDDRQP